MKVATLSAGIVPVFYEGSKPLFLILRSYNYWDFPKGVVENDENVFLAAQRELQEEAGISEVKFPFGEVSTETEPYGKGKVARYYIGVVKSKAVTLGVNPELGRAEHQEYRWVSYEEALKLFVPRLLLVLEWARKTTESY